MEMCEDGHEQIAYDCADCPACGILKDAQAGRDAVLKLRSNLDVRVSELKDLLADPSELVNDPAARKAADELQEELADLVGELEDIDWGSLD